MYLRADRSAGGYIRRWCPRCEWRDAIRGASRQETDAGSLQPFNLAELSGQCRTSWETVPSSSLNLKRKTRSGHTCRLSFCPRANLSQNCIRNDPPRAEVVSTTTSHVLCESRSSSCSNKPARCPSPKRGANINRKTVSKQLARTSVGIKLNWKPMAGKGPGSNCASIVQSFIENIKGNTRKVYFHDLGIS
jgi:hypothetical protein